jgi:hypothetical protein
MGRHSLVQNFAAIPARHSPNLDVSCGSARIGSSASREVPVASLEYTMVARGGGVNAHRDAIQPHRSRK